MSKTVMTYNNTVMSFGSTPKWMAVESDPYNPLDLPAYTLRLKYTDGVTPTFDKGTAVQVSSSPNVWDLTYHNSDWSRLLFNHTDLIEVLGANSTDVRNMNGLFHGCSSMTAFAPMDTSSVTDMGYMCNGTAITVFPYIDTHSVTNMYTLVAGCTNLISIALLDTHAVTMMNMMMRGCTSLQYIPLFSTESVTDMWRMCYNCVNVQGGALALYQQASSQAVPPSDHSNAFQYCGSQTQTGLAELNQIPQDWGGTMS